LIIGGGPKAWTAMTGGILECVIKHCGANVEKGLRGHPVPAHLLFLIHALSHDLINRTLDERSRDRLTPSTPGSMAHQHILVTLEVAEKFADVSLTRVDAGDLAQRPALRPAV
jgi:hypothetical protein